jgi:hypothetical protein
MLKSDHTIRCRCGRLRGTLAREAPVSRASCYCRDCQTYAHALGKPEQVLDSHGGTDVVATLQQHLRFTEGATELACLSLSDKGLLRWHARCCGTPIANTARDPKLSYLGLVHTCLGSDPAALDAAFGASRLAINTQHAKGPVAKSSRLGMLATMSRIIGTVLWARVNGSWKRSPLFNAGDQKPIVPVRVLAPDELQRARSAV